RTHSLINRLSEVLKAATDAADYAKGIELTAPKKKRTIEKVDVGMTRCIRIFEIASLIPSDRDASRLMTAFEWHTTPQGWQYWSNRQLGKEPINAADILFFKALLDKNNSAE